MTPVLDDILRDPQRLEALRQLSLLDSPAEPAFDRLTRLATRILNAPTGLVSLLDIDRQFFKSAVGLSEPWASRRETPLSHSFCQYTVASREPLIFEDATQHDLVRENLAIPDLGVMSYADIPLMTPTGDALGTFCVIDTVTRAWQDDEIEILKDLAASVMTEIALRAELIERRRAEVALRDTEAKYEALFDRSLDAVYITDLAGNFLDANESTLRLLGYTRDEMPSLSFRALLSADQLPKAFAMIEDVLRTGTQQEINDYCLRTKAGDAVYVEILSALVYREGRPWALQGIARDIGPHKQIEAVLQGAYGIAPRYV